MLKRFRFAKVIVVVAVLLALGLVYGYAALAKEAEPGVARWAIKTSLPADADVSQPRDIPLLRLLILEDPPGIKPNDKRFRTTRIPEFPNSMDLTEGEIISTSGWLHLVAMEPDGDYHIQISYSRTDGNNCLIVEVPKDDPQFVKNSPQVRQCAGTVREFVRNQFLKGKALSVGGVTVVEPAVYVKVTGQLFYDDYHVTEKKENQHRGKKGMKAKTLWEIHPVTKIELATPPQQ